MNKLEKYCRDNFVPIGKLIAIYKESVWMIKFQTIEDTIEYIKLNKTIEESIKIIENMFPKNELETRRLFNRFDLIRELKFCPEPTLFFEVNEEVIYGNHTNCIIEQKLIDGKAYLIKMDAGQQIVLWYNIEKISSMNSESLWIPREEDIFVHFNTMSIQSLITDVFFFGVDLNPDYQRGNIWDNDDKVNLIDSIFNNNEIGRFCLNRREYSKDKLYEIIDGKQRLTTIIEFITNKFKYKNKYWYELHPRDRDRFTGMRVQIAELQESNKKIIYRYFLKMNVSGRQQDKEHIEYVKELLEKEIQNG